jgi:hypothetical protein
MQVAVRGDDPGAVIDQRAAEARGQQALGQGHADGGGQALPERAGGGFDAGMLAVFRVAGGGRVQLAEMAQVVDAHAGLAGHVQQGVEQHGAVAGGQHEAVAIGPAGVGGIEFQEAGPQHGGDVGHAHGQAGMAGIGGFHGVDGQGAQHVGHFPFGRHGPCQDGGLARQRGIFGSAIDGGAGHEGVLAVRALLGCGCAAGKTGGRRAGERVMAGW